MCHRYNFLGGHSVKITAEQIHKGRKRMSSEELQEHLKHIKQGVGTHKNKKKYTRKTKHKERY